jgi:hypothetical protein
MRFTSILAATAALASAVTARPHGDHSATSALAPQLTSLPAHNNNTMSNGTLTGHPKTCKCPACVKVPLGYGKLNVSMPHGHFNMTMPKHNCTKGHLNMTKPMPMHPRCCKCASCKAKPVVLHMNMTMPRGNMSMPHGTNCTKVHPKGCICSHCTSGHTSNSTLPIPSFTFNSTHTHTLYTRSTDPSSSSPSRRTIILALAFAASAFGLIIAFTLVWCCVKRRRQQRMKQTASSRRARIAVVSAVLVRLQTAKGILKRNSGD